MSLDTRAMYARLATERPAKAKRYRASILDTLARTTIHEIERERLEQALLGIADVLGDTPVCGRCGRSLENPTSVALGEGPACHAKAMAS